jgi:hypothetical protein
MVGTNKLPKRACLRHNGERNNDLLLLQKPYGKTEQTPVEEANESIRHSTENVPGRTARQVLRSRPDGVVGSGSSIIPHCLLPLSQTRAHCCKLTGSSVHGYNSSSLYYYYKPLLLQMRFDAAWPRRLPPLSTTTTATLPGLALCRLLCLQCTRSLVQCLSSKCKTNICQWWGMHAVAPSIIARPSVRRNKRPNGREGNCRRWTIRSSMMGYRMVAIV